MAIRRVGDNLAGTHQLYLRGLKLPPAGKTWPEFRGKPLAFDFKGPEGVQLRVGEVVVAGPNGIAGVVAQTAGRVLRPEMVPEMIDVPELSYRVSESVVTIAMFAHFVSDSGYRITGHNAELLKSLLSGSPESNDSLTYVSYRDAVAMLNG